MNTLQFAGDVSIESLKITAPSGLYQDITGQVLGVQVFEDLFSPFITGSIVVKDSLDLVNLFPFIGEEHLDMKISTPALKKGNFDYQFSITKMTNRTMVGDKSTTYELHFISIEAIIDINTKISKSFSGKCSDIVYKLLNEKSTGLQTKKKINVEETFNSTKYTSNFWSPIKNINYVADTSANLNQSPSYTFFENRDGFNFLSLEYLYLGEVYQEFRFDNYTRDVRNNGSSSRNISEDYKRIKEIKIPVGFDYITRNQDGLYGSRLYTYDITTKRFGDETYNMLKDYDSAKHLNKNPLVSAKAVYGYNTNIITMPKYTESYSGSGDVTNAKTIQRRISLMAQINTSKIEILVPGRCDYTVGMKVLLDLYKVEPLTHNDTDNQDKMFSGNYIIAAINHIIDRNTHECNIELVKESLIMNLDTKK
jgi:hypothetical protein